jgi:hypothetical protein
MRPLALVAVVLASAMAASCGASDGPPSHTAPPVTTPTSPTPQPPATTYTLSGVVKEAWIDTGLPGSTVSVVSGPSRGLATTDEHGRYSLPNLLPGVYTVTMAGPAPWTTRTSGPIGVFADTTFTAGLTFPVAFPVTAANLQGHWVGQGPYPNEPCWMVILQDGTKLQGWYKDSRDYSTAMSGSVVGDAVFLDVGVSGLKIEGRVEDERCIQAVIKNPALGGNFPIAISRGGNCAR